MLERKKILKKWAEDNPQILSLEVIDGFDRAYARQDRAIEIVLRLADSDREIFKNDGESEEFESKRLLWTNDIMKLADMKNVALYSAGNVIVRNKYMETIFNRARSPEEIKAATF